eukprot:409342_1
MAATNATNQAFKQDISLLFLDVDGVLNTQGGVNTQTDQGMLRVLRCHVERLADILKSTNVECKICISSAWRLYKYALQFLRKRLITMGDIDVDSVIIGQTSSIPYHKNVQNLYAQRICEIQSYLNDNEALKSKYNVVSFCVIDDMDLSRIGINFVHINPRQGLTDTNAQQILSILNRDSDTQRLMTLKAKPCIKLLFIAAVCTNSSDKNATMMRIIQKKTECTLVMPPDIQESNAKSLAIELDHLCQIPQYMMDLEKRYNIQSWAVLDYMNIFEKYKDQNALIARKFIEVDPTKDLSINDVLAAVSILNK